MGVDDGAQEVAEGGLGQKGGEDGVGKQAAGDGGRLGGGRGVVDDGGKDAHDVEGRDATAVEEGRVRVAADAIGVLEIVGRKLGMGCMHVLTNCTATCRNSINNGEFFFIKNNFRVNKSAAKKRLFFSNAFQVVGTCSIFFALSLRHDKESISLSVKRWQHSV